MNESLVQWTLLHNLDFLSHLLDFKIALKKGQEITTDFGKIDFIVESFYKEQLIVELETILNSRNKREYCFRQILSYKNVKFADHTDYCILFADETVYNAKLQVYKFGKVNDIIVKTYSLNDVKQLYSSTVEKLSLSFGLRLPGPANYTISYLRWLNKILKPFKDYEKSNLTGNELASYFSSPKTTNFRCYLRLAFDFEMVTKNEDDFILTQNGHDYIQNFNPEIDSATNLSSIDLTKEQKIVLLRVITNGNWTAHKVNIYWFLRFMEVTNGDWLPNLRKFESHKLDLANGLLGVCYNSRTMFEFLNFACNWCMELGLVERIISGAEYDRVYLTPLGVEINNIFSLDLQLKKSRFGLNFKYLE